MRHNNYIWLALAAIYLIWGSTYLAARIALETFPPFTLTATRFLIAGIVLFFLSIYRGASLPTAKQFRNSVLIGMIMLGGGIGGSTVATQWVDSGLVASAAATVPLWGVLCALLWREFPTKREWLGLIVGLVGVFLLNMDSGLRGNPLATAVLLLASASWAFGAALSKRIDLPTKGMDFAIEMLGGSLILFIPAFLMGEHIPTDLNTTALFAWLYLTLFGSLIAYTAYMYLVPRISLSLVNSHAYVNPGIAVLLGVFFAGETITLTTGIALAILASSILLLKQ